MSFLSLLVAVQLTTAASGLDAAVDQYTVTSWTENDGLPANAIRAIAQDRDGYLWLGTRAGLVRFDGVRFVLWENDDSQAELTENDVTAVYAARDGSLWIGYGGAGGMTRLKDGRIETYRPDSGLGQGYVQAILEDNSGVIWAGHLGGLSRFDGRHWETVGVRQGLSDETVLSLHEDRHRNLWVSSSDGVFVRKPASQTFSRVGLAMPIEAVGGFSEDASGALWIVDSRGMVESLQTDDGGENARSISMQGLSSRVIHDAQGNLWIAQGNGVQRVQRGHAATDDRSVHRFTIQQGLAGNTVTTLLEDREGNIWVATDGGLSRLSRSMVSSLGDVDAPVLGMELTKDGSLWIANDGRIVRFSGARRTWYTQREGLPGTRITALHTDRRGTLWGAASGGLARFDDGRFRWVPFDGPSQPRAIQAMADHPQGGLWLLTVNGQRFRWYEGRVTPSPYPPELEGKLAFALYTDREGAVWEGFTDGSLAVYRNDAVIVYSARDGLAPGSVRAILQDDASTVWVGTSTGLSRFKDGRFVSLPLRTILPGNMVLAIVKDEAGYLWLGMTSGILRLHPTEFDRALDPAHQIQYLFYSASDGLRGFPTRHPYSAAVRAGDGLLRFATSSGVSVVDPRNVLGRRPIGVRIESAAVNGQVSNLLDQVPARTSRLEITYRALSLTDAGRIQFRHILEGFDASWVNAGSSRQASYSNLPPGRYRFRVAAGNEDGIWTDPPAVWEFSLQPTFYQTRWFYAISSLGALLAVLIAWQVRQRQMQKQFGLVIEERARVAREIHDTLLQSLVGLTLQLDTVSRQWESAPTQVRQQLVRMRRQVTRYIRETRQSIWDLSSPRLETRKLATALREAGDNLTYDNNVRFEHVTTGQPAQLAPKVDEQLLRIGQEAISNAVRHAQATVVRVELEFERDTVRLRVTDDGCGFDRTTVDGEPEQHFGLMSMEARALRIGAHFRILSRPGAGTTIEATVPCSFVHDRRL